MPLRDHFRPPLDDRFSWEGLDGRWPAVIVQQLQKQLPAGYVAEPRAHFGSRVEVDIGTFETDESRQGFLTESADGGGVATAVWAPARPSIAIGTALPGEYDEYEVRIYDVRRGRHLVAAVEIVSPANKDRLEHRSMFVAKCAAMLPKGVAVSIVHLVTVRNSNLYLDLLDLFGQEDPTLGEPPPTIYAASCRWTRQAKSMLLEAWSHALSLGQTLPTLPLWLAEKLVIPLDLESSYEQACHDLRIS
jgi:hypothetical protein